MGPVVASILRDSSAFIVGQFFLDCLTPKIVTLTLQNIRNYSPIDAASHPKTPNLQQHCCEDLEFRTDFLCLEKLLHGQTLGFSGLCV